MGGDRGGRRRHAFSSLAGNTALLRVLAAYLLFILTEYAVWIAMLVFAYTRGGTAVAGLVAVAQLAPAAVVAPVAASLADRRAPVVMLGGGGLGAGGGGGGTGPGGAVGGRAGHARADRRGCAAGGVHGRGVRVHRRDHHPAGPVRADPVAGRHPGSADRGQRGRGLARSCRSCRGRAAGRGADLACRGGER